MKNPFLPTADEYYLIPKSELGLYEKYPEFFHMGTPIHNQAVPVPKIKKQPELVFISKALEYIDYPHQEPHFKHHDVDLWNSDYEAGQLRYRLHRRSISRELEWIKKFEDVNLYLFDQRHDYLIYSSIYHLLPIKVKQKFNLPMLRADHWPTSFVTVDYLSKLFKKNFTALLSNAFASYIFPFILKGKFLNSFSKNEPTSLLAHDLKFWLPHMFSLIEEKVEGFEREDMGTIENIWQFDEAKFPDAIFKPKRKKGYIWKGEKEATEFTKQLVKKANGTGSIDKIIECVKSNRLKDDFSPKWSHAKEDFERRLYSKRNKVKVKFVEVNENISIHSDSTEVEDNILWNNFLGLVNKKEREVLLLLRKGITNHKEISLELGYAGHSPVTKMMKKIREKAKTALADSSAEFLKKN